MNGGYSVGTLSNTGAITGGAMGIWNQDGTIGTLSNSGTITSTSYGVWNASNSTIGTLTNSGAISGGSYGIYNDHGTIGILSNSGTISDQHNGIELGGGTIGTLLNSGVISGFNGGISNYHGTVGVLSNSGTISGHSGGIYNISGTIGTLANTGTISGGSYGVCNGSSSIGTLSNTGAISGTKFGIYNSGTIGTLLNGQGGNKATAAQTALTFTGKLPSTASLPSTYLEYVTSTTHYGQLVISSPSGAINSFDIAAGSALTDGTYDSVITGLGTIAGQTADVTGTFTNGFSWDLHDTSGTWSLTVTGDPTNINTGSTYQTSDLGGTVNPVFAGGTLQVSANGTIASNFTVDSSATNTIDGNGKTSNFTGIFSDATSGGRLIFANSGSGGSMTFTGANTYSGGSTVQSGVTVFAGNDYAFGTGSIAMAAGSTLGFVSGQNFTLRNNIVASGDPTFITPAGQTDTLAGVISDGAQPGIVEVQGSGTLVMSGVNTYSGGTTIDPGATLQIAAGGQIGPGAVANAGTLILSSPQIINGNYTQTGALTINAASQANGGRIVTSGSAAMPNVPITFNAQSGFIPAQGSAYTLVAATAAGTSYAGDKLTANVPGYTGLWNLATQSIGASSDLVIQFQANPSVYGDALMTQRAAFLGVANSVGTQLTAFRGAPSASGTNMVAGGQGMSVWMAASGQFTNTNGGNGASSYTSSGGGAVVGLDKAFVPGTHGGIAVSIADQGITAGYGQSFKGQFGQVQAYATTQQGAFFLDLQAGASTEQGTVKRAMAYAPTLQGSLVGFGAGASIKGGARYDAYGWNVEPSVTLGGVALSQNGVTETGGTMSNVSIGRGAVSSAYTLAGVEVDHAFAVGGDYVLTASGRLGWMHEMLDTAASLTASNINGAMTFGSAPIGRNAADVGLQADLRTQANVSVFARYETLLDGRSNSQVVQGGVRYSW